MEIFGFSAEILVFLCAIAVFAGLVDTLAGGGGLITIPALLFCGLPPLQTLATNKLQGCFGSGTASFLMLKKKNVYWRDVKWLMLASLLGSAVGTIVVQFIDTKALSFIIPIVLLAITLYFIFSPSLEDIEREPKMAEKPYRNFVVSGIGFYDGMFGPGTGTFFSLSGIALRGKRLIQATATAKTLNFASNISALIIFIFSGHIVWICGMVMILGQMMGAWLGTHFLFRVSPAFLRWLVVIVCVVMLSKYVYTEISALA